MDAKSKQWVNNFNSCSPHVTFWAQALHQTHQSVIVDGSIDLWMDGQMDLHWKWQFEMHNILTNLFLWDSLIVSINSQYKKTVNMQFSSFLHFPPCTDGKCLHIVFGRFWASETALIFCTITPLGIINSWEVEERTLIQGLQSYFRLEGGLSTANGCLWRQAQ